MADTQLQDPRARINAALRELRNSMSQVREGVVLSVMRRNKISDDITKMERQISDLTTKAELAEKINNASLAEELRTERKSREAELERLRSTLATAEAEAESAKTRLPEEETRITQQIQNLQAELAQIESGRAAESAAGAGSNADAMFRRAADKVRDLQNEAAARGEVAGSIAGASLPALPQQDHDAAAEKLLQELEAKQNSTPGGSEKPAAQFLELDTVTETNENAPAPPPASESAPAPEAEAVLPQRRVTLTAEPEEKPALTELIVPEFQIVTRPQRRTTAPQPDNRIRVAGIGTGGIFRGAHLPAYVDIPQMQLVALCDPDKEAQDLAYKRYQSLMEAKILLANGAGNFTLAEQLERDLESVQICDDISEVIEVIKPDIVDICTQPFLHVPLSIQALEAGLHVMCEKPISRSWLESQRLIEAVERTGKLYQHNENWLWDKDYYTAKKLIDAGAIGEPILMFLATAHGGPEGNPKFWNADFGGGGALLDNGIHAIGAAWFMSGLHRKPTLVKSAEPFGMSIRMPQRILDGRYQQIQVEDDAHILIRFEDSQSLAWTTAHVEGSWSHRDSPDTAIIGTTGKIVFSDDGGKRFAIVQDAYDREARRIEVSGPTWQPWPSSHYGEILNFIECVRNNAPSICGAAFGADCSAIVGASYLSQSRGKQAVHVDEFKRFAQDIAAKYPNDSTAADNALVDALLSAVRKSP